MKNETNPLRRSGKYSIPVIGNFLISCFSILIISSGLFAQTPGFMWAGKMAGNLGEYAHKVAVDVAGNTYETFSTIGISTIDCDPGPGVYNLTTMGSIDCFVVKLDANGNFVWARQIGGTMNERAYSLITDNAGNVYITGYFTGTPDFDPGAGVYPMTSAPGGSLFILKLDNSGNFIWAIKSENTGTTTGNDIMVDPAGNIVVTGNFAGTVDFAPGAGVLDLTSAGLNDIFIAKYNPSGNLIWVKQIGGTSDDIGKAGYVDAAGLIYVTGTFQLAVDFDPGAGSFILNSVGLTDDYIIKMDGSGNLVWAKVMGSTEYDASNSIAVDASGNVYTTGTFRSTADFDPGTGTFNLSATGMFDIDVFILKLDAFGSLVWAKQVGCTYGNGDVGMGLALDNAGNIYVTGYFTDVADFDPGPGVYNLTSAGGYDMFVMELNPAGNLIFANSFGSTSTDYGKSIAVSSAGIITIAGEFIDTVDFDPGPSTYNLTSLPNNYDAFALRLGSFSSLPVSLLSFQAKYEVDHVNLNWSTSTEKNNDYFAIEKSTNGKDFEILTTIPGAGTSCMQSSYTTVDMNPSTGINYYRLKQTDFNGSVEYLKTVTVATQKNLNTFAPYAYQAGKSIGVAFHANENTTAIYTVYDTTGRLIASQRSTVYAGLNNVQLQGVNLQTGIHYLHITLGEDEIVEKICIR